MFIQEKYKLKTFMAVILARVAHARNRATPSTTHTAMERKALSQP